jgi:hypothetical protein
MSPTVKSIDAAPGINEHEPLLTPLSERSEPTEPTAKGDEDDDTPLPMGQILWLCYVRLVEPIAFFSVFAFLNQMLWEIGDIGEGEVGFYSGLIVCPFSKGGEDTVM